MFILSNTWNKDAHPPRSRHIFALSGMLHQIFWRNSWYSGHHQAPDHQINYTENLWFEVPLFPVVRIFITNVYSLPKLVSIRKLHSRLWHTFCLCRVISDRHLGRRYLSQGNRINFWYSHIWCCLQEFHLQIIFAAVCRWAFHLYFWMESHILEEVIWPSLERTDPACYPLTPVHSLYYQSILSVDWIHQVYYHLKSMFVLLLNGWIDLTSTLDVGVMNVYKLNLQELSWS